MVKVGIKTPQIYDGGYLATDERCRLYTLYKESKRLTLPSITLNAYLQMLAQSKGVYPLLLPFGNHYYLLDVEIKGDEMNLKIKSMYPDGDINVDYMGLMAYVAVEIIRRGYYERDNLLRRFKAYYDKIRSRIPEEYMVYVNGNFATLNFNTMHELLYAITEGGYDLGAGNMMCVGCPLSNVCPMYRGGAMHFRNIRFGGSRKEIAEFLTSYDFYLSLKSMDIEPMVFIPLLFFRNRANRIQMSIKAALNYTNEFRNAGVVVNSSLTPGILSLADGLLYQDTLEFRSKYPNGKVYQGGEDITDTMLFRDTAARHIRGEIICPRLEKYLSERYPPSEKLLFYFAATGWMMLPDNHLPHSLGFDTLDDIPALNGFNVLLILKKIITSKIYRDGLIYFDLRTETVDVTRKTLDIFRNLCGGDII